MIFSLFDGEVQVISSRHIIALLALFMLISPVIMFFFLFLFKLVVQNCFQLIAYLIVFCKCNTKETTY